MRGGGGVLLSLSLYCVPSVSHNIIITRCAPRQSRNASEYVVYVGRTSLLLGGRGAGGTMV